jgi:hypothetical protein
MGMDLKGVGGEFWFNVIGWGQVLRLAQLYGWEPLGTVIDEDDLDDFPNREWNGSYQINDRQRVTANDARNMADALESALSDLSEHNALEGIIEPNTGGIPLERIEGVSPLEWFSGEESKQYLKKFIDFCRAGEFIIG